MTWGYRHENITKEFDTKEELIDYLDAMDPGVIRYVRYWYIKDCFNTDEVLESLVDGDYMDISPADWLDDALNNIEDGFTCGEWDWKEDTIEGIYYRE